MVTRPTHYKVHLPIGEKPASGVRAIPCRPAGRRVRYRLDMEIKRILIFGAGVIGSVYAGKLALAGHDVSVLARNERLKELEVYGLLLCEIGKPITKIEVVVISELKPEDVYDYIFVTVRKDQVQQALPLLAKNSSKMLVFMVNTSSVYSDWIEQVGFERVIPAFPGAGGTIANSIVYYSLTSRFVQPTTVGEMDGGTTQRIKEIRDVLQKAGFPTSIARNMDKWQKSHVAMVCPLAYGIYADGGNNYSFANNKLAIIHTSKAFKETLSFLKNCGIGVEPGRLNNNQGNAIANTQLLSFTNIQHNMG